MTASARPTSLTHLGPDKLSKADIAHQFEMIKERLENEFKDNPGKQAELLLTLDQLAEFEMGRFLIANRSFSGFWTYYIINGFTKYPITSPLERFLLEKAPPILATRQRFGMFQTLLTKYITSHSVVCSVPCGMMADLLMLDLPGEVSEVRFVGIDLDGTVFDLAKALAKEMGVRASCEFFQRDAWQLDMKELDVVTTNGLNIYVKEDSKVVALYRGIWGALKNGGRLICSALTPPPTMTTDCEWDMNEVDIEAFQVSTTIFKTILGATWSNFRSSTKTCEQLRDAGFDNIEIYWDRQRMFPTFLAQKPILQPK